MIRFRRVLSVHNHQQQQEDVWSLVDLCSNTTLSVCRYELTAMEQKRNWAERETVPNCGLGCGLVLSVRKFLCFMVMYILKM